MVDDHAYRALVESCPDSLLVHSRGVIRYASPRVVAMLRAKSDLDLVGRPVMEFIHPEDRAEVLARQTAARAAPVGPATFRLLGFDGHVVAVETTAASTTFEGEPSLEVVVRDVSGREEHLVEETHVRVTRDLVRRMLALVGERGARAGARRELGRALAAEAEGETQRDLLWAFTSVGLGQLRITAQDGERFEFEGRDLLEVGQADRQPSCELALGFAEGIVERLTGKGALGNEMRCQGQGAACCRFVVKARAKAA